MGTSRSAKLTITAGEITISGPVEEMERLVHFGGNRGDWSVVVSSPGEPRRRYRQG
jgi:hypothetical protein